MDRRSFVSGESDFRHVEAYINSLEPPKYPFAIDRKLAEQGRGVFEQNCAECHGTYGKTGEYPERIIPWDEVKTDPVRFSRVVEGASTGVREKLDQRIWAGGQSRC